MKQRYILFVFILIANYTFAQNVVFTDPNFKQLFLKPYLDLDDDGEISLTEALSITSALETTNVGITDLTGIESMPNLTSLIIRNNPISASVDLTSNTELINLNLQGSITMPSINITGLTKLKYITLTGPFIALDVSNKPELESLIISDNTGNPSSGVQYLDVSDSPLLKKLWSQQTQLTSLDVTQNPLLEELVIGGNNLTSIDLSQNPLLNFLSINSSPLGTIDVSMNPILEYLDVGLTGLSTLDLQNNPQLKTLNAIYNNFTNGLDLSYSVLLEDLNVLGNDLTELDLTNNPNIKYLEISNNKLSESSIDFSHLTQLQNFFAAMNLFVSIDLSNNPNLKYLDFKTNNYLKYINLKNGNNENTVYDYHSFGYLPNLLSVCIDDLNSTFASEVSMAVANTVMITSNCVLSNNEFNKDKSFLIYPNPTNSNIFVNTDNILKSYEIYSQTGQLVGNGTFNENDNAVSLQHLANGIYFLKITTDKGTQDAKIIKK